MGKKTIALHYDEVAHSAVASLIPGPIDTKDGFPERLAYQGKAFTRVEDSFFFWNHLLSPSEPTVVSGFLIYDCDLNRILENSRILTSSANVINHGLGYHFLLGQQHRDPCSDANQDFCLSFGSATYRNNADCIILLDDICDLSHGLDLVANEVQVL